MAAREIALSIDELRGVTQWAADCAARALPLFESAVAVDARPRSAVSGALAFATTGRRTAELRSQAMAAHAAAREAGQLTASSAARAAGCAAASPYTHPLATPHQSKHILSPAVYLALACESADGHDAATGDAEIRWAIANASSTVRNVVLRFPPRRPGRTRLATLYHALDIGIRG